VAGLLTTLNSSVGRVSIHGVHDSVLEAQAEACRLPLVKVPLPDPCSDEEYRAVMAVVIDEARRQGIEAMAFGDLFLADVRAYREKQLAGTGIAPIFPLWARPTALLALEMIEAGLEAIITCVDTEQLDASFVGRAYDLALLDELPASVDPCAENGEFHSFVYDGPIFRRPVRCRIGERVVRDNRFHYCDLVPLDPGARPLLDIALNADIR